MQVKDSVVVITGASSGIGRATALAFAEAGATVVLAARRSEALTRVAQECSLRGAEAVVEPIDVSDAAAVEGLASRAVERFGRLDVWVNNAAVGLYGTFLQTPARDFRRVIDVNVMGYVNGSRAALSRMNAQGHGVLVNVASVVGVVAQPYASAYVMSKFAVRGLSSALRQELRLRGSTGVHVCTVLPATTDTPFFAHAANYSGRRVLAMPPVHRPERVARVILNTVRVPRREVMVGIGGKLLSWESRMMPGLLERIAARRVDKKHLSQTESAPVSSGNLHEAAYGPGATHGGWRGSRLASRRRLATATAIAAAAIVTVRRLRH